MKEKITTKIKCPNCGAEFDIKNLKEEIMRKIEQNLKDILTKNI